MKPPEADLLKPEPAHDSTGAKETTPCTSVTDQDLLAEYAATKSDDAFAEIAARHTHFVYAAALRQTENQTAAEEITQAVFVILARKASVLRQETVLRGWLFRAVRYAALDFRKVEARRIRREREAAQMNSTGVGEPSESAWHQMAPWIDEALASLSAKDRDAVLLRFFEEQSFRDIGERLGTNDNAARLRVVRALKRLRGWLQKRGIAVSAGLLSDALLAPPSQAASPALVNSVTATAASRGYPAAVAVFVRAILRQIRWRTWTLRGGPWLAAFLLAVAVAEWGREDPGQIRTQVRATALAIDRAISFGDPYAFVAQVHFRTPEQEQFKPVLVAFVRAATDLRKQIKESFGNQPMRLRLWLWTVGQLLRGQPRSGQDAAVPGRVTDDFFRPYQLVMVRAGRDWKWDCFANLEPEFARECMKTLAEKTVLCERVRRQIQQGEITTAEQAIALVQGQPN
jgi:RNA polymerase sigma factor (sigma-70 family)